MSTTTEALVVKELKGQPTLETINLENIQPKEALVKIEATGICHTDLSLIDGTIPAEFPNVLGHEGRYMNKSWLHAKITQAPEPSLKLAPNSKVSQLATRYY